MEQNSRTKQHAPNDDVRETLFAAFSPRSNSDIAESKDCIPYIIRPSQKHHR
jgi:hypothetical protein